jgi:hypothetical protein
MSQDAQNLGDMRFGFSSKSGYHREDPQKVESSVKTANDTSIPTLFPFHMKKRK